MNTQATDQNTSSILNVLPPGGTASCRLGNELVSYGAERLEYVINVDSGNCLFTYQYAIVLEDPSHALADQPKFTIYVMDALGVVVDTVWGIYEVSSMSGLIGWNDATHLADGETVHWKDWVSVAVDLSAHIGENITVQFTTYDCAQGAHFGYSYISCYCGPLAFRQSCDGAVDTISVPEGFIYYLWNTGETTQSVIRPSTSFGDSISCRCITESRDTVLFKGTVSCVITGIEDVSTNNKLNIYPNPVSDIASLNIDNPDNAVLTLNIYNVMGELVRSEVIQGNQHKISTENLSNGIYIVEVKIKDRTEKQKLIIQR
jgi:hypothetical protein